MAQSLTSFRTGVFTFFNHGDAIYKYIGNSDCVMVGIVESGRVADFCGIENDDVGPIAFPKFATSFEMKRIGGQTGHFADGIFELEHVQLANVPAKDAGVIAVAARMGHAFAELSQPAVAS